jgi:hypothetical protein
MSIPTIGSTVTTSTVSGTVVETAPHGTTAMRVRLELSDGSQEWRTVRIV